MTVGWWSGGITSAVACKIAIDLFGKENCRIIFMDTFNEHQDTYRFKDDCSKWYGLEIETITAIGGGMTVFKTFGENTKALMLLMGLFALQGLKEKLEKNGKRKTITTDRYSDLNLKRKNLTGQCLCI